MGLKGECNALRRQRDDARREVEKWRAAYGDFADMLVEIVVDAELPAWQLKLYEEALERHKKELPN